MYCFFIFKCSKGLTMCLINCQAHSSVLRPEIFCKQAGLSLQSAVFPWSHKKRWDFHKCLEAGGEVSRLLESPCPAAGIGLSILLLPQTPKPIPSLTKPDPVGCSCLVQPPFFINPENKIAMAQGTRFFFRKQGTANADIAQIMGSTD